MNRIQIIAGAALLTVLSAGGAAVAVAQSTGAAAAGTCQVTVDRSQTADTFRVDKQTLESGDCVCYVYTGPQTQGAAVEAQVANALSRRDCGAAVPPQAAAASPLASKAPYLVAGIAGVGGIGALLAGGGSGNDSPGG